MLDLLGKNENFYQHGSDGRRLLAGKIPILLAATSKSHQHAQGLYIPATNNSIGIFNLHVEPHRDRHDEAQSR